MESMTSESGGSIPIIDLRQFKGEQGADLLAATCKEWGVFLLVNHGIDELLLGRVKEEVSNFFELPMEEKAQFTVKPGDPQGYGQARPADKNIDVCHRFFLYTSPASWRKPHLMPMLPTSLREILETYVQEVERLSISLLNVMGGALGIGEEEIHKLFTDGIMSARMNFYPPHPQPEMVVGISPHSDATAITILAELNGVSGLEVQKDGCWIPVNFIPGSLVVNLGDNMEILSNGKYKSAVHRVTVNPKVARQSIAIFRNPSPKAELGPSPSVIGPENPLMYKTMGMEEYLDTYFSTTKRPDGKAFMDTMRICAPTRETFREGNQGGG